MTSIDLNLTTVKDVVEVLTFAKSRGIAYAYDSPTLARLLGPELGKHPRLTPEFFHDMHLYALFIDLPQTEDLLTFREQVYALGSRPSGDIRRKPSAAFKALCGSEFCAGGLISRNEAKGFMMDYASRKGLLRQNDDYITLSPEMREGLGDERAGMTLTELDSALEAMFGGA